MTEANDTLSAAVQSKDHQRIETATKNFLLQSRDPLSDWLDKKNGANLTENSIFETLPRFWEDAFHKDMTALNVNYFSPYTFYNMHINIISLFSNRFSLLMF